jgi:hemolysin-activating ACP:hemolysin acyltransferase
MITLRELLQQLDLRLSLEQLRSLELGIHVTCPAPAAPRTNSAPRDVGWHVDRLTTAVSNAASELFFDSFGRYCGKLVLASLDHADRQRVLAGDQPGAEVLANPLGNAAWVVEAEFRYGALRKGRETLKRVLRARGIETIEYLDYRKSQPCPVRTLRLARPRPDEPSGIVNGLPASFRTDQLGHESAAWLAEQQAIGAAVRVLASCDRFRSLTLSEALSLLSGPITLGQYQVAYTPVGRPISFRSWAYLTDHAIARLVDHGPRTLSVGCWNQGLRKTLICDWSMATHADESAGANPWAWELLPESRYSIFSPSA